MAKLKILTIFMFLGLFVTSCGLSDGQPANPQYANLSKQQLNKVLEIDKKIDSLHKEMEKYLGGFQKEGTEAQGEVYGQWQKFSTSVKEAGIYQEKANRIREQIIELQQQKVKILENASPKK